MSLPWWISLHKICKYKHEEGFGMGLNTPRIISRAMAQAASCWPVILETPAYFQASPYRICAGQLIILVINVVIK